MIVLPARRSRVMAKYIAHERRECRQCVFGDLIKCRAHYKPPYIFLNFISGHYLMGLGPNLKTIPQNSGKQIRIPEGSSLIV